MSLSVSSVQARATGREARCGNVVRATLRSAAETNQAAGREALHTCSSLRSTAETVSHQCLNHDHAIADALSRHLQVGATPCEEITSWEASSERDTAAGRSRGEGLEARREAAEAQPHVGRDPVRGQAGRAAPQQRAHERHESIADRSFICYSRYFLYKCSIEEAARNLTSLNQMPNRHWSEGGVRGSRPLLGITLASINT